MLRGTAFILENTHDNGFSGQATPFAVEQGEADGGIQFRLSRMQTGRFLHGDRHVADGPELEILRAAKEILSLSSWRHVLLEIEDIEREKANSLLTEAGFIFVEEGAAPGNIRNLIYRKEDKM